MADIKVAEASDVPVAPVTPEVAAAAKGPKTVKVTRKLMEQLQDQFDGIISNLNDETADAEDIIIEVEEAVLKLEDTLRKRGILDQEYGV